MEYRRVTYQPQNPVTRFFAVVAGIGLIALTFFLGIIFFAAFAALGLLAWGYFQLRRWWLGRGQRDGEQVRTDGVVEGRYRVVDRDRE